jgi:phosphatidylglycerol lysyltransferase
MRSTAEWGHGFLTLGLTPLSGSVAPPLRLARRGTRRLYDFAGVHRYRQKLRPRAWQPIHLGFPDEQGAFVSVVDTLAAFTDGGFWGFGLSSLVHAMRLGSRPISLSA